MKNWSCPKKIAARRATLPSRVHGQYWSMAGLCTGPGCEVAQILDDGIIEPSQFHGVEIDLDTYEQNVAVYPELAWHHGDFFETMRRCRDFNPGLVNADLIQTVDTAANYIAKIMYLISPFDVTLVVNFVMQCRAYRLKTPDYVLDKLAAQPQFRLAMRSGWEYDGECYLYDGTGERSKTVMGTFVFTHRAEVLSRVA